MISILIITKDEELNLPRALASVTWSDDIHVFDSGSSDSTITIARAAGVHVYTRVFDNFSTHRNAALTSIPFRYDWVFLLDADECPTPALSAEMQKATKSAPESTCAFRLRRRDYLFGTWLKHAQISPFYIRLVRPGRVHYSRAINEILEVDGPPESIADLAQPLDHFPFHKGIASWIAKHNVYSTMEAELIHRREGLQHPSWKTALRHPDFHTRRLHQKALFYRLPGRPVLKWLYMVVVRGAMLDGYAGLTYATLQAIYEYLIVLKVKELQQCERET